MPYLTVYGKRKRGGPPLVSAAKRYKRSVSLAMYRRKPGRRRFRGIKRVIRNTVMSMAETKECLLEVANNTELKHNQVHNLSSNAFFSAVGTHGEDFNDGGTAGLAGSRLGNTIYVKGIKCAIMLESQQYRPQVTYWLYLVRNKANRDAHVDTTAEMFEGRSTTLPMDYIDTSKVDVMFCKKFVLKMGNQGTATYTSTTTAAGVGALSSVDGTAFVRNGTVDERVIQNPQLIKKFYVPINRTIKYNDFDDDGVLRNVPSSMRYQWVMVAYGSYASTTGDSIAPVGHVSLTTVMKFKDV